MIQQKMIHHLKKTKSQIIASANKDNKKNKRIHQLLKRVMKQMLFYLYGWHLYHGWVLKKEDL